MTKGGGCSLKNCFSCSLCTVFIVGIFFLLAWLIGQNPQKPIYSIENFYVPALDKAANDTTNTTITVNFQFSNRRNKYAEVYYESLNFTLYYGANRRSGSSIGSLSIPRFRQGNTKRTRKVGTVEVNGVPWKTALEDVSNGTAIFGVQMLAAVKYDLFFSKSKLREVSLGADVKVNDRGAKTGTKGIVLSAGLTNVCNGAFAGIIYAIFAFLMF